MLFLIYKVLHLAAVAGAAASLGALAFFTVGGGNKDDADHRALAFATHGVSMLLLLITGFGMVARLSASYASAWIWVKLVIWFAVGALIRFVTKSKSLGKVTWALIPALIAIAAFVALHKPGNV
jgi:hypothetical protein